MKILDTPSEERFDRLTRLARRLFDVPIALVSFVDAHRQWFKSRDGLDLTETPREMSFCAHAVQDGEVLVVPDALSDPRFEENPLVLGDPNIRFYAGQPIRAPGGAHVGTLCIIDHNPRDLEARDREALLDLAELVEREIAAVRLATIDELTGLSNRRGFRMLATQALSTCRRTGLPASLLLFDLDGFKQLNDNLGHDAGDNALASFAADLLASYRHSDVVARLGGDEFCALLTGVDPTDVPPTAAKFASAVDRRNEGRQGFARLRYSVGTAHYDPTRHEGPADLLREADALMYEDKRSRARSSPARPDS